MRKILFIILFSLCSALSFAQYNESVVKSALVYNLINYIDWEDLNNEEPLLIGMYTEDTTKVYELRKLAKTSLSKRKLLVVHIKNPAKIESLNAIYIDNEFNDELPFIYDKLKKEKILIITNNSPEMMFSMIDIYKNKEKISFRINRQNLDDRGFSYSTDILILGGTYTDLKEVYLKTYQQLDKNKKQIQEFKNMVEDLKNEAQNHKENNKTLSIRIDSLSNTIQKREENLRRLENDINIRKGELKKNYLKIIEQQSIQNSLKDDLSEYMRILDSSYLELDSLNKVIVLKQEEIKGQNLLLQTKDTEIQSQKKLIFLSIIALIAIILAGIMALRAYFIKRKTSLFLEKEVDKRTSELKISEANFKSLVQNIPDYIVRFNTNLKITYLNENVFNLFPLKSNDKGDFYNSDEIINQEYIKDVIENKILLQKEIEYNISGKKVILEWLIVPVNNQDGELSSILCVSRDISTLIEIQNELKEAKEKAERSDHLKSAFLANMSHEIRTPLNAILGFSNLLKSVDFSKDEKNEYIEIIREKGYHLLKLIDDIIDISKIEAGYLDISPKPININVLINQAYKIFKEEVQKQEKTDLELILDIDNIFEKTLIITDEYRLRQVIINLLSNAVKFTDKGHIKIICRKKKSNILFEVEDTGIGISNDKIHLVFGRFMQVSESRDRLYGGTGLGLSISQKIVEMLGGKIWVESELGKGSSFCFTIPFNSTQNGGTVNIENVIDKNIVANKRILVADDEPANVLYLKKLLESANAEVLIANNGTECLNYLKKDSNLDLVLVDIKMPEPDGYEVMKTIKKEYSNIPVIAQTAYAMSEDKEKAINSGFDGYITKPINDKDLFIELNKFFK